MGRGHEVRTYTFGEPRNGDQAFGDYVNGQVPPSDYFRVTHANDGVPHIPPRSLGYEHHGTEYWQSEAENNDASTTFDCGDGEPTVSVRNVPKLEFR